METIKHAVASVKEKVTHHHKHDAENSPGAQKATSQPTTHTGAAHPDPPTHGHKHTNLDPPGAPGIIETPAPGVVADGTGMHPGMAPVFMPRI